MNSYSLCEEPTRLRTLVRRCLKSVQQLGRLLTASDQRASRIRIRYMGTVQVGRAVTLVFATIRAATQLHNELLHKVIRLPMSFFDTQPTGRLVNRFTKDVEACDLTLQQTCSSFTSCVTSVGFSILVVIAVTRGAILLALIPLLFLYKSVQQYYLSTSRELKRLDSIAFSPIFSHFGETLSGLMTVRAFRRQPLFAEKNETLLDRSNRCYWPIQVRATLFACLMSMNHIVMNHIASSSVVMNHIESKRCYWRIQVRATFVACFMSIYITDIVMNHNESCNAGNALGLCIAVLRLLIFCCGHSTTNWRACWYGVHQA